MKNEIIKIDSTRGGNGDIWMRLVSFYVISKIVRECQFYIKVPSIFLNIATHTFGDRLKIISNNQIESNYYVYTHLGIKDLIIPILKGQRFISPYQRAIIEDKKKKSLKDFINIVIFKSLNFFGLVLVPEKKWITSYQGFLDTIGIKQIKNKVSYPFYLQQLKIDSISIMNKLKHNIPVSIQLKIPHDLHKNIIVFPTGTSRQFIPLWWAIKYFPNAYYAFYVNDLEAKIFLKAGLKVVYFFKEPGDIIYLSKFSRWCISTDSFPSHLLQFSNSNSTILLTEVLKSRIVFPFFSGNVIDSVAPCHPCLHKERKANPKCAAGFEECLNWESDLYFKNILKSIKYKS